MANDKAYQKIEEIIINRVVTLEEENSQLKHELALAQAKLEIYDRMASVSDSRKTIGFGPPMRGGNEQ